MDVLKLLKQGRGRGGGGGRGRSPRGGRGRGRGRGGGGTRGHDAISRAVEVIDLDDGDDICNMALANVELENNSLMQSFEELNNATTLDGYDAQSAGGIWIYPINRPIRDYQYDIVSTSLFNNTLVSLPTGLGKTFISAVVMYNFARWYPSGIIVFMAPTRPLVAQQLDACHNTVGIDSSRTVELTGQIPAKKREHLWKIKTVFFLTPQVMLSDLERGFFQLENVRCVVVDEAHKSLGNHAYVQVIAKITEKNRLFRVLALTATPGSDLAAVQQVFKNLLISRVELRSDNCPDILPYTHDKKKEVHVVKMTGYVKEVYERIIEIFQEYSGKLMKANALVGKSGIAYSKFQLLKARETFRANLGQRIPNYQKSYIEIDFNICISLAHAIEILNSHGLRTFYIYLLGVLDKKKGSPAVTSELRKNEALQQLIKELQQKLNISIENSTFDFDMSNTSGLFSTVEDPNTSASFSHSYMKNDHVDYTLSHPKLQILKDIVQNHFLEFSTRNDTTRAIIFSQYRDSVQEIGNMLNSLQPMVKPMIFVGKANTSTLGPGLKQKDQIQIVQRFRDGGFNVLVATSVGEEGLDIGEVDLIICFDASKSPTRLIQRMGRTGRQRDGRTVFLLTSGKEERSYHTSINQHSNISNAITDPRQLEPFLYKKSPRMVPQGIELSCYKMEINLPSEQQNQNRQLEMDDEEDENIGLDTKPKPKPNPTPAKPKKKTTTAKGKAVPPPGPNIAKMFEKILSQPPVKKMKTEETSPGQAGTSDNVIEIAPPPPPAHNEDAYFVDDAPDFHMLASHGHHDAFSRSSVINSIFDMNSKDRTEWVPCTTFFKKDMPSSKPVSSYGLSDSELDNLLLDDEARARVWESVKRGDSFSFVNPEYCPCGNIVEAAVKMEDEDKKPNMFGTIRDDDDNRESSSTYFSEPVEKRSFLNSSSTASTNFSERMIPIQTSRPQANILEGKSQSASRKCWPTAKFPEAKVTVVNPRPSCSSSTTGTSNGSVTVLQNPPQNYKPAADTARPVVKYGQSTTTHFSSLFSNSSTTDFSEPAVQDSRLINADSSTDFSEPAAQNSHVDADSSTDFSAPASPAVYKSTSNITAGLQNYLSPSTSKINPGQTGYDDNAANSNLSRSTPSQKFTFKKKQPDKPSTFFISVPSTSSSAKPSNLPSSTSSDRIVKVGQIKTGGGISTSITSSSSTILPPPSSPRSIFGRILSSAQQHNSSSKQLPPPRGMSPDKENLTDEENDDSISVFSASPDAELGTNPFLEEFRSLKTKASTSTSIIKSTSPAKPNLSRTAPTRGKKDENVDICDENDQEDYFDEPFFDLEEDFEAPPEGKQLACQKAKSPAVPLQSGHFGQRPSSQVPKHYGMKKGSESSDDDFDWKSKRQFKFKKAQSKPPIISPTTTIHLDSTHSDREDVGQAEDFFCNPSGVTKRYIGSPSPVSVGRQSSLRQPPSNMGMPTTGRFKMKRHRSNPFIESQAQVSEGADTSDSHGDHDDDDSQALDDSFVDHDDDNEGITETDQAMYLKSIRDPIPRRFGRIEKPLSPKHYGTGMDSTAEGYDVDDSFCQEDDEVDYLDVGLFTQAMNQAKIDVASGSSSRTRYQTRRTKKVEPTSSSGPPGKSTSQSKQRRRIIAMDSTSDED